MSHIKMVPLSSLYKLFPEIDPTEKRRERFSALKNEPLSFQIAYRLETENDFSVSFYPKIETDLPISLYEVGFVPVLHTTAPMVKPESYRPGLFPDLLLSKKVNPPIENAKAPWGSFRFEKDRLMTHATMDSWKALWFTVNEEEKNVAPGKHTVTVKLYHRRTDELCGECSVTVEIIDATLPKQKLFCTHWFHCDCLCDTYGVEMFSERFWEIFRSFASAAAKHGMNMILTPCFTPELDTPIGAYRRKAQLVGVEVKDGKYSFDFSLLQRFLDESRACGIQYFEHAHFFTQWGAEAAPQVWATVNGKEKRIFGWDTCAWGKKYTEFLHAYIPALLDYLKKQGLDKKFFFHVSDEPNETVHATYSKARKVLGDLLDGYMCGDALSDYEFYEDGSVSIPIVVTTNVKSFMGKCKNLWAYYTGGQCTEGYTNRRLDHASERNRMLGIHLYTHDIKGFLHWGYNFYYDTLSHGVFDPKINPCFFEGRNPGTSYLVYPATDGTCISSIRQKVFYEGINDMRALQALQKRIGRKATLELVTKYYAPIDFSVGAESEEKLLAFRDEVNQTIAAAVKK